jgi:hypothetical protein
MEPMLELPKAACAALAGVAAFTLGVAGTGSARADTPCKQWRFDGYTEFDMSDGTRFTFIYDGVEIPFNQPTFVRSVPPNGGPVSMDEVTGYIDGNNHIEMYTKQIMFIGGVRDDGTAYGWEATISGSRSASWRSAAPLRCADNGG